MTIRALGISWFRREDYAAALKVMVDSHNLQPTYERWLEKAEGQERKYKERGLMVLRIYIDPDKFPAWCARRGLALDARARVAFAADGATEKVRRTH
jgi:hypothetical protein